jgi:hypothetical protein
LADYNQVIALQPELALVYNDQGALPAHLGNLRGAFADYERALAYWNLDQIDLAI